MRAPRLLTAIFCSLISFVPSLARAEIYERTIEFNVRLREGVFSKIAVTALGRDPVTANCYGSCSHRVNILAVPGLTHSASTFRPWAEHVLDTKDFRNKVGKVFLLDFTGHGKSGLPTPAEQLQFGNVALEDYQTTLLQVISGLELRGCKVGAIVAHSLGGLVTQMVQDKLVSNGLSLRFPFGVKDVIIIGSNFPQQLPWYFGDSGIFAQVAPQFIKFDAALGTYLGVDLANWLGLFFTNPLQQLAPNTPSVAQVVSSGYISNEPLVVGLQLGSLNGLSRPKIEKGIFAASKGTDLTVVAMEQDIYSVFPSEQTALLAYLTNKEPAQVANKLKTVTGPDAVHDVILTAPQSLDSILKAAL